MSAALPVPVIQLLQVLTVALGAPGVTGVIAKVEARLQGRRGPRIRQPYYDLAKLFRKEALAPAGASWFFLAAPLTMGALKSPWVLQPVFAGFSILSPSWLWLELPLMLLLVGLFTWAVSGRRLLRIRRVPAWRSATIGVQGPDSYTAFGYANPTRRVLAGVLHTRAEVREIMMADQASDDGAGAPDRPDPDGPDAGAHLRYAFDVIEVVETYLYRLALGFFAAIVTAAKRLQSGRLDAWTPTCFTCSSP